MTLPLLWLAISAATAPCHPVDGDRITAADLAAVLPVFAKIAPAAEFGYAPLPGAVRRVEPAELTRFASANGLEYHGSDSVCFEPALVSIEPQLMEASIRETLSGLGMKEARIEILDYSHARVPAGTLRFPAESLPINAQENTATWNGYVERGTRRYPVWARVRMTVPQTRVVATVAIRAGDPINSVAVRVEKSQVFPSRALPLKAVSDCEGKLAKRYLAPGTALSPADVMEPWEISQGDTVLVEIDSGAAVLKIEALAQEPGHPGQTIALRNAVSGKVFHAVVTGKKRARYQCTPEETEE